MSNHYFVVINPWEGGKWWENVIFPNLVSRIRNYGFVNDILSAEMALILFSANLIGVTFSRSLHYQFYVWYFHSLPFLLWSTDLHLGIRSVVVTRFWVGMEFFFWSRIALLLLLEWGWNVYPSTMLSSVTLLTAHLVILIALYNQPRKQLVIARKKHWTHTQIANLYNCNRLWILILMSSVSGIKFIQYFLRNSFKHFFRKNAKQLPPNIQALEHTSILIYP